MVRQKLKTETTTLKMTPEVRRLWEQCAAHEYRTLTSMFEVMVRDCAKRLNIVEVSVAQSSEVKSKKKSKG